MGLNFTFIKKINTMRKLQNGASVEVKIAQTRNILVTQSQNCPHPQQIPTITVMNRTDLVFILPQCSAICFEHVIVLHKVVPKFTNI